MIPIAVLDYLDSNEERFIEELFAYTRISSISAQSDHGLALSDDNAHSPDQKFSLDAYIAGMKMGAHLWPELAAVD